MKAMGKGGFAHPSTKPVLDGGGDRRGRGTAAARALDPGRARSAAPAIALWQRHQALTDALPFCAHEDSQVKDSRPSEDGAAIRRRRQCEGCGARFTTFERVQLRDLTVVKKDDKREPFDRAKLERAIGHACRKRDIDAARDRPARLGHPAPARNPRRRSDHRRHRPGGDGRPEGARPCRLHPLRQRLQGLQRSRRLRRDRRSGGRRTGDADPAKPRDKLL